MGRRVGGGVLAAWYIRSHRSLSSTWAISRRCQTWMQTGSTQKVSTPLVMDSSRRIWGGNIRFCGRDLFTLLTLVFHLGAWAIHVICIIGLKLLFDVIPGVSQETSWTLVNIVYMFSSYLMFHWVRGVPFEFNAGAYDNLNLWEQIDNGDQYTPAKKFLLSVPIVLFLLSTHYTHYDLTYFTINVLAVLGVVIPKLPSVSDKNELFGRTRVLISSRRAIGCEWICSRVAQRIDSVGNLWGRSRMTGEKRCGRESKSSDTFIMDSNYAKSRTLGYIWCALSFRHCVSMSPFRDQETCIDERKGEWLCGQRWR